MLSEEEIIERIEEFFELNYEILRLEGGHALMEQSRQMALNQIIYYYRKMRDVAERVTETEVKLTLPEQKTPKGRNFTIQGIVDIVREENETWMYDIKTHDREYIEKNLELYQEQLDVYSYIWQELRGEKLNHTAIISTALSNSLRRAIKDNQPERILHEMSRWNPLVPVPFKKENVEKTIKNFGAVVDNIEEKKFKPAPVDRLNENVTGTKKNFATHVCRNCDARFSCPSYREFNFGKGAAARSSMSQYFDDFGNDAERDERAHANLEVTDFGSFESE